MSASCTCGAANRADTRYRADQDEKRRHKQWEKERIAEKLAEKAK